MCSCFLNFWIWYEGVKRTAWHVLNAPNKSGVLSPLSLDERTKKVKLFFNLALKVT